MSVKIPSIKSFIAEWKKSILVVCFFSMVINMLQLTFTFYMFAIYSNVIATYSRGSLYSMTVAAFFALVVLAVMYFIRSKLLLTLGSMMAERVRSYLFRETVKEFAGPWKDRVYRTGLSDAEHLVRFLNHPGFIGLLDLPWAPMYLVIVYFFHPILGLTATVLTFIAAGMGVLQERLIRGPMTEANRLYIFHNQFGDSIFRNWEIVHAMGMKSFMFDRWDRQRREILSNQVKGSLRASLMQSIIKPFNIWIQVAIYGVGAYLSIKRVSNPGAMIAASILAGKALGPMSQVTFSWKFFLQARKAYRRLTTCLDLKNRISRDTMPLPAPKGSLAVQNLTLVLNRRIILANVSFSLEPGEFMVVMGPSGAGKTTLCRTILGLWPPAAGAVRIDGSSIFHYHLENRGKFIGYLPQDVELFPGTVAENICRMHKPDPQELERVVKLVHLEDLIDRLPDGLDTFVEGEGGVRLSGGQRQRIGLARALYGSPKLLVLDEPNSNLDDEGDRILREILMKLRKNRLCTTVIVSHKTDILQVADKILLLRDGRVVMFGPRDRVIATLLGKPKPAAA